MDTISAAVSAVPFPAPAPVASVLLPIDTSAPDTLTNDRIVAIHLLASLTPFVGQTVDTNV